MSLVVQVQLGLKKDDDVDLEFEPWNSMVIDCWLGF